MSTQGTVANIPKTQYEELLEDWGLWVKSSGLGMFYAASKPRDVFPLLSYTEREITQADRTIAQMKLSDDKARRAARKLIKEWFWWGETDKPMDRYFLAIDLFAEDYLSAYGPLKELDMAG